MEVRPTLNNYTEIVLHPENKALQDELEVYNASKLQLEQLRADNLAFFDQQSKSGSKRRNRASRV